MNLSKKSVIALSVILSSSVYCATKREMAALNLPKLTINPTPSAPVTPSTFMQETPGLPAEFFVLVMANIKNNSR